MNFIWCNRLFMFRDRFKRRLQLTGIHVLFSLVLLCLALSLVYGVWYPDPLQIAFGVTTIYLMLLSIDLILGPLLTFLVFKEDKKKLKFDLGVILIIQLSAYLFGLYTLAQGRPVWQVFVVDDIELVSLVDLKKSEGYLINPDFKSSLFMRPQWVSAVYSTDKKVQQQQKEAEMFQGISLAVRPEIYQEISKQQKQITHKLKKIDDLYLFNPQKVSVDKIIHLYPDAKGWLPVKASKLDMVALFDEQGRPLSIVNLRPWL